MRYSVTVSSPRWRMVTSGSSTSAPSAGIGSGSGRFEAGRLLLGECRHGGGQQQGDEGAAHDGLLKMVEF